MGFTGCGHRCRAPLLLVALFLVVAVPAPSSAAQKLTLGLPSVLSATPRDVSLEKGGASQTIVLNGKNLQMYNGAQLINDRGSVPGISVTLGPVFNTGRNAVIKADASSPLGTGLRLRLIRSLQRDDLPASIFSARVVPLSATIQQGAPPGAVRIAEPERWLPPQIDWVPGSAFIGEVIEIRGQQLGNPLQSDKTKVYMDYGLFISDPKIEAPIISLTPTLLRVRVPNGAKWNRIQVETPGGRAFSAVTFDPLYLQHWSSDIFSPTGTIGGITKIYESRLVFAGGEKNSAFIPSNNMIAMGMPLYLFTFPTMEQKVDMAIARTTFRARIPGTDRLKRNEVIQTQSLSIRLSGKDLKISASFESDGAEMIGEYETQDVLTGRIYWKHFMNVQVDNLKVDVTVKLNSAPPDKISMQVGSVSTSFNTTVQIFETPPFSVDRSMFMPFVKKAVEDSVALYLNSGGFMTVLSDVLGKQIKKSFGNSPVKIIEMRSASDGGLDFIGSTRYR